MMKNINIGIEIGGTKLQVGLGSKDTGLLTKLRRPVQPENGAAGIRQALIELVTELLHTSEHTLADIGQIGIGFGGPLDTTRGVTLKSFQISGWDNFALKAWAERAWQKPVFIQNDASVAGLAEALYGSGVGYQRVFYMTIGSGIGGGWIHAGKIDEGQGLGAAEIGHMWVPDPQNGAPVELEQVCSGWSIGHRAQGVVTTKNSIMTELADSVADIDARMVYTAAEKGDAVALDILRGTCQTLGIAIGNVIALLHPERVIIGGGVSLMGPLFWTMLDQAVSARALPVFSGQTKVIPAALGEEVVLIGALCLG